MLALANLAYCAVISPSVKVGTFRQSDNFVDAEASHERGHPEGIATLIFRGHMVKTQLLIKDFATPGFLNTDGDVIFQDGIGAHESARAPCC